MNGFGQISNIDIRMLKIFRTVVESNGFSAAEATLNISRSAISITISDLEKRLGFRLCQRGRSGFALTDEGQQVYEAVLRLLASMEDFRAEVNAMQKQLRGKLAIGISDNLVTMPEMTITDALGALRTKSSEIDIRISMLTASEVEKGVLDGRLQVGVVPMTRQLQGLDYLPLYREQMQLYCSDRHPLYKLSADALVHIKLKQYDAVALLSDRTTGMTACYNQLHIAAEATDREGMAFLIHTGQFIGYLPSHYAWQWQRDKRLAALEIKDSEFTLEYAVISRRGARPNRVMETFLQELKGIAEPFAAENTNPA